ncbi:hypothetical protein FSP39_005203 [Pinctada imbricata]|uniref:RNA-directed DNA polymerase n=1 Tax=Pinctada imbricata TaxID=66713 RepID=A0AA89BSG6_PINIB|nr:hypothetical protein FSP39_005203 [Pinctada imbricata]
MATALPQFPQFDVHTDEGNVATRWKKWLDRYKNLVVALGITDKNRQKALLLHYAGIEVHDIFSTLQVNDNEEDVFKQTTDALNAYFAPKVNREFEVYKFRNAKQNIGENIDTYHTRLRKLAETCEFTNVESEIKSQIVQSCSSSRLRRRALREEMNLENLLKLARSLELSDSQASHIEKESVASSVVNKLNMQGQSQSRGRGRSRGRARSRGAQNRSTGNDRRRQGGKKCFKCGYDYPHKYSCPAIGQICKKCGGKDHFARTCKNNPKGDMGSLQQVDDKPEPNLSSSEDDYVFKVNEPVKASKHPYVNIELCNTKISMLVDTGATVNIISNKLYKTLKSKLKLQSSSKKLYGYDQKEVDIEGCFETQITYASKSTTCNTIIYVAKGDNGSLLSYQTAVDLGIIPVIRLVSQSRTEEILSEYADRFEGMGKVKDVQLKIHIDESIAPIAQQHRRIPFHMRKKVEAELKRLEDLDIIEKVEGPTPWVSPIVVAPKQKNPNEIRICVDMRLPNQAVKREKHIMPTVEDIISEVSGSKHFSKLDLNAGFHQIELAPESRNITTFTTHVGLRRYKRLIFGLSSAAEKFQSIIRDSLEGIEGVRNLSDDIIVHAKTQEEHDDRLKATLQRLRERNITLNKSKCEFNRDKVEFFGYVFSNKGLSADPKKITAIKEAKPPANVSELRSFLGLANYVSRFIPNFASIVSPLRTLTHKNVTWRWEKVENEAFKKLKNSLIEDVMEYFDPSKQSKLVVDASPVGLGAILMQEGKVISYASKTLSDIESRYSQTEKEALAIVWGCEHYHLYLYGSSFMLYTDHKPLEVIFNNPKSRPPARIERWRLRLQPYDFIVKYRPGTGNPADFMSRQPIDSIDSKSQRHSKVAEEYLSFIVEQTTPKAMTLSEISVATKQDRVLQNAMNCLVTGNWSSVDSTSETYPYLRVKEQLSIATVQEGSILLFDTRIVVPKQFQQRVVNLAHEGHQGLVKTKQLLREKVWFPGLSKLVESTCRECIPCLASTHSNNVEPLKMTKIPERPWTHLSADFCGPFPTGEYLLVVVDDHSRFPVVEFVHSTSAKSTIPKLDKIFSLFGIPEELKTDNGPPFQSADFAKFADYLGFRHRKITPLWPKANGTAERFMRTLNKTIKAATVESLNWKQELFKFLRNYRATPHSTTSISPAEALLGRKLQTKLPELPKSQPKVQKSIIVQDDQRKSAMKEDSDLRNNAKESELKESDFVLVKQPHKDKLSTPFNPKPLCVTDKKGSMITAEDESGHKITRNSSFFKKVEGMRSLPKFEPAQEEEEEFEVTPNEVSEPTPNKTSTPNQISKRPIRSTKRPAYLSDYVT